jgi:hypothetical protein
LETVVHLRHMRCLQLFLSSRRDVASNALLIHQYFDTYDNIMAINTVVGLKASTDVPQYTILYYLYVSNQHSIHFSCAIRTSFYSTVHVEDRQNLCWSSMHVLS